MYEQGVALVESSLGAQHPNLALSLRSLASFYAMRGELTRALALNEKALHIQEIALPPDDPATKETLRNLAELYEKTGKHQQSQAALARAGGTLTNEAQR
jgi:tetratricopeptide (TPR) repeat protein